MTRSVFRSQYFDTEEDYSRDEVNFTGVPEILYIIFMLISADTGYPITRLFGVSPAGMNSTGESDMRNYYDAVRSKQTFQLQTILLRLVKIISEWLGIEEPYIKFAPLQTMNDKEQAELEKVKADTESVKASTYKAYIDAGILEPFEARFLEFGDTLDKIPVPEDLMPPIETVEEPAPPPPAGEENPDKENDEPQAGEETEDDETGEKEPEDSAAEGEEEDPEGKKKIPPKKAARGKQTK
jgi:type IV secretory pathway VirB10-like protein